MEQEPSPAFAALQLEDRLGDGSDPVVQDLKTTLDAAHAWCRHTDSKATATVAAIGLFATAAVTLCKDHWYVFAGRPFAVALLLLLGVLLLIALYDALACISPTLGFLRRDLVGTPVDVKDAATSVLFFDHIRQYTSPEEYLAKAEIVLTSIESRRRQYSQQVWAVSKVCYEKQVQIGWSLAVLRLAFLVAIVAVIAVWI